MTDLYRVTPRNKKSVEYVVSVFSQDKDGNYRSWTVTETWRQGQGFRLKTEPVTVREAMAVDCDPEVGWGIELEDMCAVEFDFDDSFTDEEQEEIEAHWNVEDEEGRWGTAWLFDSEHEWQVEENFVRILGPVKIDLVDEQTGFVVEDDVLPHDDTGTLIHTSWPFGPDVFTPPKDSEQGG